MSTTYYVCVAHDAHSQPDMRTQQILAATAARAWALIVSDVDETALDAADEPHTATATHTGSRGRQR